MDETPSAKQATPLAARPALDPHAEIVRLRELNRRWKHAVLAALAGLGFVFVILVIQFAGTLFTLSLLHEIRNNTAEANREAAKQARELDAAYRQVQQARGEAIQAAAAIRLARAEAAFKKEEMLLEALTADQALETELQNGELITARTIRLQNLEKARAELNSARVERMEAVMVPVEMFLDRKDTLPALKDVEAKVRQLNAAETTMRNRR